MDSKPVFIISRQSHITEFTECTYTSPLSFRCNCVTWFPSHHFYFLDFFIGCINNDPVKGVLNKNKKMFYALQINVIGERTLILAPRRHATWASCWVT